MDIEYINKNEGECDAIAAFIAGDTEFSLAKSNNKVPLQHNPLSANSSKYYSCVTDKPIL